jgi:hypothetical protein
MAIRLLIAETYLNLNYKFQHIKYFGGSAAYHLNAEPSLITQFSHNVYAGFSQEILAEKVLKILEPFIPCDLK